MTVHFLINRKKSIYLPYQLWLPSVPQWIEGTLHWRRLITWRRLSTQPSGSTRLCDSFILICWTLWPSANIDGHPCIWIFPHIRYWFWIFSNKLIEIVIWDDGILWLENSFIRLYTVLSDTANTSAIWRTMNLFSKMNWFSIKDIVSAQNQWPATSSLNDKRQDIIYIKTTTMLFIFFHGLYHIQNTSHQFTTFIHDLITPLHYLISNHISVNQFYRYAVGSQDIKMDNSIGI